MSGQVLAFENIRFSSLFAAPRETSPAAKSQEKRMFSQARQVPKLGLKYWKLTLQLIQPRPQGFSLKWVGKALGTRLQLINVAEINARQN